MTTVGDALAAEAAQRPAEPARFATGLLGPAAVLVALLSAFATFVVLAGLTPINPTHDAVVTLLGVNALAVLLLLGIIGREVWHILQARRRGKAAARLHVQIVALFSIIAALPAILVAVVASVTLDRGLDRLFSIRARSMIENSLIVADAYIREHAQSIRADTDAVATIADYSLSCRTPVTEVVGFACAVGGLLARDGTNVAGVAIEKPDGAAAIRDVNVAAEIDGQLLR